jgi:adenylyltransferase/sulfurtransferase
VSPDSFTNKNAVEIANDYDMIIDCTDNPASRYLICDVAVALNIPLVSGSAVKWEGQLTVYHKTTLDKKEESNAPCYRCLFPEPTPAGDVCNCSDAGVFGPVPGVIGTMQANEAIKLIIGYKEGLMSGRMLMYDALDMRFRVFKLRPKNPDCVSCGSFSNPNKLTVDKIKEFDYAFFVNPVTCVKPLRLDLKEEQKITWADLLSKKEELKTNEKIKFFDVRTEAQFNIFSIGHFQFKNYPLSVLKDNFKKIEEENKLKEAESIFITCRSGNNSTYATKFLEENGYSNVFNINDGIKGYKETIDNNIPFF